MCKIKYWFTESKTKTFKALVILLAPIFGVFLFGTSVQAIIIAPMSSVTGVVINSDNSEVLSGVQIELNFKYRDYNTITNNQGIFDFIDIDCDDDVEITAELDGYEKYQAVIDIRCYTTMEHNIILQPIAENDQPVIIIPGIMASWNRNLLDKNPAMPDEWVLDPIFHTYDELVEYLVSAGGYIKDQTLFTFPYDWRRDNILNADDLKNKINDIKQQTGATKVDLVAHSMGGLVARYYITSSLYQDDVDQLIFIATPQRGAPKSYLAWEGGYLGTNMASDFIKEKLVERIGKYDGFCQSLGGNECVHQYIRNYPIASLPQLLPDYDYIYNYGEGTPRIYPYLYPRNYFLEYLNKPSSLDKFYDSGVEVSVIYNNTPDSTISSYKVIPRKVKQKPLWEFGYPKNFSGFKRKSGIIKSGGDVTVPIDSSIFINSSISIGKLDTDHRKIVSKSISDVLELLKNEYIPITVIDAPDNYVIIGVYSPIDIKIITPQGQTIGKDFINNLDINELSHSYYSGHQAENEFILLPAIDVGDYQLKTQGTDDGEYIIEISQALPDQLSTQIIQGTTQADKLIDYQFSFNGQEISEVLSEDLEPPNIQILKPENTQYLHSENIDIDVNIADKDTGVLSQIQYLDDDIYGLNYIDMYGLNLGYHHYKVQASDFVENNSEMSVEFEIIASFESIRSDINRLYSEGDIKYKHVKKVLLKQVDILEKWYNKINKLRNQNKLKQVEKLITKISQTWFDSFIEKKLGFYLQKGWISEKANTMLLDQFKYLINNL